nr:IucA/IucC family siderophore biosynthesis protein [Micromonospora deserti]
MADLAAAHALFGCHLREVAVPAGDAELGDGEARIRLRHLGVVLRCAVGRVSPLHAHRYEGPVQRRGADRGAGPRPATPPRRPAPPAGAPDMTGGWEPIGATDLAALLAADLTARTGVGNDEFVGQVRQSRTTTAQLLAERPHRDPAPTGDPVVDAYVDSEQSLLFGHPQHPTPKWRTGATGQWRRYAPELRAAFRLHWLAVPAELTAGAGPFDELTAALDPPPVPAGHRALPVHPWQLELVPPADRRLRDLGPAGVPVRPTASVRTCYAPDADLFCKTSLHVRITNCLRKNSRYELTGAVALSRLLAAVPLPAGVRLLAEPAYRTVDLPGADEAYGTILRAGLRPHLRPGQTPVLAGALAASPLPVPDPVAWWRAYVRLLVPAALRLWLAHGVVHEAHLQNVLVVLDAHRWPVGMLLRDLEGVKLDTSRWPEWPARLPRQVGYRSDDARRRVVYCLFVNHLAAVCAALADARPGVEPQLWRVVREVVAEVSDGLGNPPELRALLAGAPLVAKANLLVRWHRAPDRDAAYVPVPNPFGGAA